MRTQNGNNNAYCQDNEISWFNWDYLNKNADMLDFFKKIIAFTKKYTILQRRKFFLEMIWMQHKTFPDISWFGKDLNKPLMG